MSVREDAARLLQNYEATGVIVCQNLTERSFICGFKRTFLTSRMKKKWCENGLRESGRPCSFSAAECLFWDSVVSVREDAARLHQN